MTTGSITNSFGNLGPYSDASIRAARKENAPEKMSEEEFNLAFRGDDQKKCPYSFLAKDGFIEYNGVVLECDYKHNAINLGDVSDPKKVLRVNLPSGGSFNINVDKLGDVQRLAGMFSPEDLNAILSAIHEYNHCTSKVNEIEEEKSAIAQLGAYKEELIHKIINNETETKFRIGAQELTIKEWNRLLENFDKKEDALRENIKQEIKDRMTKEELEERINQLTADRA